MSGYIERHPERTGALFTALASLPVDDRAVPGAAEPFAGINADLLRRLQTIQRLIDRAMLPGAMAGYCQQVREFCAEQEKRVRLHLAELRGGNPALLGDLFNATSVLTQKVRYADRTLTGPLIRFRKEDVLALRVLQWLHQSTKETAHLTFALAEDGARATAAWYTAGSIVAGLAAAAVGLAATGAL